MTITATCFARDLAQAWPGIPERTRQIIRRDLEWEFQRDDDARKRGDAYPLGTNCDREAWEQVRIAWGKRK